MSRVIFVCCVLFALTHFASAAYCNGKPDPNAQPNGNAINTNAPVFVKSVVNGSLYTVDTGMDTIPLVHLWGSPYQKGVAHATLMKDEMVKFFAESYQYFEDTAADAITGEIPWFPKELAEEIGLYGLDFVLDLEIKATLPFTADYYQEEINGMASVLEDSLPDAAKQIQRLLLMGELTKGSCSMFGAWGDALPSGFNLLQLRALDWDMDGPFRDYPQITVYHYDQDDKGQYIDFANVGYTGFIGSLNGVNAQRISTSEIGVTYPDDSFGEESREGNPFTYLLRDILQGDSSLDAALDRITNTNRTCDLILGVGDGKMADLPFRGIQYSASVANFYIDTDMMPYNASAVPQWHPRLPNYVYYGMDWLCPNFDIVLAAQLEAASGQITAELAVKNVTAIEQSGTSLVTYYSYTDTAPAADDRMFVSFAARHNMTTPENAYDRGFVSLQLDADLFDVKQPTTHPKLGWFDRH